MNKEIEELKQKHYGEIAKLEEEIAELRNHLKSKESEVRGEGNIIE